jgi:uridylate kinase
MKKREKIIVISLGGSLIVPDKIDLGFLRKFKKIIKKHTPDHRFVVVCGGGNIARKYINALKKQRKSPHLQSLSGIAVTRLNARFMTYFFGKEANEDIPHNMRKIKNLLLKNEIIFCGALRYHKNETSDATSAKLARFFNTEFINLTDVGGLYNKNPKKYKSAKLIPKISWKEFKKITDSLKYDPGQHFVLDQHAAKIIKKYKIKTYILGKNLKNLDNLLAGKKFKGTTIQD